MFEGATNLLLKLMLALALGGLVGLEREFGKEVEKKVLTMGIRTSMLISMFGFVIIYLCSLLRNLIPLYLGFAAVLVIASLGYQARFKQYNLIGMTTYVATLIVFLVGVLVALEQLLFAVVLSILMTALMAYRTELHSAVRLLTKKEIESGIKFAIIAFVVLPLLPNRTIDPWGIFNPFSFWLIVLMMSGIFFITYIALRIFQEKGILISGFLNGIIASIPTVFTLTRRYARTRLKRLLPDAVLLATAGGIVSEIAMIVIASKGFALLKFTLVPIALSAAISFLVAKKSFSIKHQHRIETQTPFALMPAVKFALALFAATAFVGLGKSYFGFGGSLLSVIIGSFASVTGTVAGLSMMFAGGSLTLGNASFLILVSLAIACINKLPWGWTKDRKIFYQIVWRQVGLFLFFVASSLVQYLLTK